MQTAVQAAEFQPTSTPWTEDWLAVVIGLLIFVLSLGVLGGADILGWVVTTSVWTDISKALAPAAKSYAGLGGVGALIATYVALLVLMTAGAAALSCSLKDRPASTGSPTVWKKSALTQEPSIVGKRAGSFARSSNMTVAAAASRPGLQSDNATERTPGSDDACLRTLCQNGTFFAAYSRMPSESFGGESLRR